VTSEFEPLPSNLAAAHALILAERNARVMAEANAAVAKAEAANAQADLSSSEALTSVRASFCRRPRRGAARRRRAHLGVARYHPTGPSARTHGPFARSSRKEPMNGCRSSGLKRKVA